MTTCSTLGWIFAAAAIPLCAGCGQEVPRGPRADAAVVAQIRSQFMSAETPANTTAAAQGTGWAKLSGVIKLSGDPPPARPLAVGGQDAGICAPGGKAVLTRSLLVDSGTKGIANVVVFARKVSRVNDAAAKPASSDAVFDQKDCLFTAPLVVAQLGQQVVMKNSDPMAHNVKMKPAANPAFNQLISSQNTATYKATAEEGFPVQVNCDVHPWMKAYLLFRKTGYFAVTKADGSFEIPNLPAGEDIEFQIWHERVPNFTLDVGGVKIDAKGRFKLKLAADEDKKLAVDVPAAAIATE